MLFLNFSKGKKENNRTTKTEMIATLHVSQIFIFPPLKITREQTESTHDSYMSKGSETHALSYSLDQF